MTLVHDSKRKKRIQQTLLEGRHIVITKTQTRNQENELKTTVLVRIILLLDGTETKTIAVQ